MTIRYTYTTLVAALKSFAEDTDPDYVANIDDFIGKAELRILRDLDFELFESWSAVTISGGNRFVTKPNLTVVINSMNVRNPSTLEWTELPRRSFEYCVLYSPVESVVGQPRYFAEGSDTLLYVVPTPDQSYAGANAKVRATIRPLGLSSTKATTWVSDHVSDLLFHACMIEAQNFLKNTPKMEEHAKMYQSLMPQIREETTELDRRQYKGLNTEKSTGADD